MPSDDNGYIIHPSGLRIARPLHDFVKEELLPGTDVDETHFWKGAEVLFDQFGTEIEGLLERRQALQQEIDDYHRGSADEPYEEFLRRIGYLVEEPEDFVIETTESDPEVGQVAGPQLVVPISNARFATNAANARWGSLYDALYGSDAIDEAFGSNHGAYDERRGAEVIARVRGLLDEHFPLVGASHADVTAYDQDARGFVAFVGGLPYWLADEQQFRGVSAALGERRFLLQHHGLHVEIVIDRSHAIGSIDRAGVADVILESALTVIMDLEDSVAAVDADDKTLGYRNWLQLMQGRLSERVTKGGETFTRRLEPDREYLDAAGTLFTLPGRALMFIRHVGHLMTTDAVLDRNSKPVFEGVLDALISTLGSLHDLRGSGPLRNSRTGSIYVVKPKLHGPDEVAVACRLLDGIEALLDLPAGTIKIGVMDEERRTSVNLKACIREAKERIAFINTGFLDRTGDEIHTSMHAGPMVRKNQIKSQPWITAYEQANVDLGISCGFIGRAQIGKGMWAKPDNMAAMLEEKISHPLSGASCAWVPSPTAATLHAIHYHQVDVLARQRELVGRERPALSDLLTIPLGDPGAWTEEDVTREIENNLQGALGYVVRWIDSGIGCSKVPAITGTNLMEDRATCRISTQHVANWLLHGVIDRTRVEATLEKMARVVDQQNAGDPDYVPLATDDFSGHAFQAVRDLILQGTDLPSGYTEPVLHPRRIQRKRDSR